MEELKEFDFVVSGTGSRSLQNASKEEKRRVLDHIKNEPTVGLKSLQKLHGNIVVLSGGAEGFDTALMKAAIDLDIPYIIVLPSNTYVDYYWKRNSVTGTDRLEEFVEYYMEHAYSYFHVCDFHMYGKANFVRNQWMVDHADAFYVYNPASSGTAHCLKLIKAAGKDHHIIPMPE